MSPFGPGKLKSAIRARPREESAPLRGLRVSRFPAPAHLPLEYFTRLFLTHSVLLKQFFSRTPARRACGRRIRRGLRPHAPTLKERSRLNSPVGTKRVAAQTANVCTVRGLLCDGPASSVSSNFAHSFEFPDPNLRPRRCSTPKSHSGADWDSENRILNPR